MRTLGGSFRGTAVILSEKLALGEGNRRRHAVIRRCCNGTQSVVNMSIGTLTKTIVFGLSALPDWYNGYEGSRVQTNGG